MDFRPFFKTAILHSYPKEFEEIDAAIEAQYRFLYPEVAFAVASANLIDRRLLFSAYFLATIQVLELRGESEKQIRSLCLGIAESYVQPRNLLHRWLKRLPARLMGTVWMRLAARFIAAKAGTKGHPDGFLAQIITEPSATYGLGYGIDIVECGICKLFDRHGASRHVPLLCEIDHLTTSLAGLELVRSGTIAAGAGQCDFRFRKLNG